MYLCKRIGVSLRGVENTRKDGQGDDLSGTSEGEEAVTAFVKVALPDVMPSWGKLIAEGLIKSYHGRRVVNHIDLAINPGEVVGLLGPNGAGKTTTFYMIVGLIKPDGGTILLDGENLSRCPMYIRARKGLNYLPQEPSIFRKLTVRENILAILETLPITTEERQERLRLLLGELDLTRSCGK